MDVKQGISPFKKYMQKTVLSPTASQGMTIEALFWHLYPFQIAGIHIIIIIIIIRVLECPGQDSDVLRCLAFTQQARVRISFAGNQIIYTAAHIDPKFT